MRAREGDKSEEYEKAERNIGGLTPFALETLGYDGEKILKAVETCVTAMGELTIAESMVARKHLDSVIDDMYKRSPDTLIKTIQPKL